MLRILHFSDTHAEKATLQKLASLASNLSECDVAAHTGDAMSSFSTRAPDEWNDWPQKYKLSVPGDHLDTYDNYSHFTQWLCIPPWHCLIDDLLFVGVDSTHGAWEVPDPSELNSEVAPGSYTGLVVLTHRWLDRNNHPNAEPPAWSLRMADSIVHLALGNPVLILHGHDHNEAYNGSVWEETARLGQLTYCRSNVCSSSKKNRGIAHLIIWSDSCFQYVQV